MKKKPEAAQAINSPRSGGVGVVTRPTRPLRSRPIHINLFLLHQMNGFFDRGVGLTVITVFVDLTRKVDAPFSRLIEIVVAAPSDPDR
jgi:hypothetical protein